MADLFESISAQMNEATLEAMAAKIGSGTDKVQTAVNIAIPVLLNALVRNSASPESAEALYEALNRNHDGAILKDTAQFIKSSTKKPGSGILKHLFGGKSDRIAQLMSQKCELNVQNTLKLLEILTPIIFGVIGKEIRYHRSQIKDLELMLINAKQKSESHTKIDISLINKTFEDQKNSNLAEDEVPPSKKFLGGLFSGKR